jgi:hypothetical protein
LTARPLLVLLALASCSIDDRTLRVSGACVTPAGGGLVSDFSPARPGICPAGICAPDLVGRPTVSLGTAGITGLAFPYGSPGLDAIALTLAATPSEGDATPGQALRALLDSGSLRVDASIGHVGFALQFLACVDTSAFSAVSFTAGGTLGSCPLRFAAQFKPADAGTLGTPCPVDECFATSSVPVASGTTTLTFADAGRGTSNMLAGLQWEVTVPDDPPGGCRADFTIDDIRLVR